MSTPITTEETEAAAQAQTAFGRWIDAQWDYKKAIHKYNMLVENRLKGGDKPSSSSVCQKGVSCAQY